MRKTALPCAISASPDEPELTVAMVRRYAEDWLLDGEIRQLSKATLDNRRIYTDKLLWFLEQNEYPSCGVRELRELRAFLAYLGKGHDDEGGRWGNERFRKKNRPGTIQTYHGHLRTFFRWLVSEGSLSVSPMESLKPPVHRADQVQPFTEDQVNALFQAAKKSLHPRRDSAILLFFLDTGARASELCALKVSDLDLQGRTCRVVGKGDKSRSIYIGKQTVKALWQYLEVIFMLLEIEDSRMQASLKRITGDKVRFTLDFPMEGKYNDRVLISTLSLSWHSRRLRSGVR